MYFLPTLRQVLVFLDFIILNLVILQSHVLAKTDGGLTIRDQLGDPNYAQEIEKFWKENAQLEAFESTGRINIDGKEKEIKDAGGIKIHYTRLLRDKATEKGAIVISTGRTESCLKYKEVAYDLWNNGYSIYIIDHRGQGLSDREKGLDQREKGHVKHFGLFVSDFKKFVENVVQNDHHENLFLIAHSMGGAITSLYLEQESEHPFRAVAFTSPMHKIQSSLVPGQSTWVTCPIAWIYAAICDDCFVGPLFAGFLGFGGGKPYVKKPFEKNEYTYDSVRYGRLVDEYERNPDVRLGDPTHGWLSHACAAAKTARSHSNRITIPVQLYQAADDSIVHPDGHQEFCSNLPKNGQERCGPNGMPIRIADARHELLIEEDTKHNKVLEKILEFFEANRKK